MGEREMKEKNERKIKEREMTKEVKRKNERIKE